MTRYDASNPRHEATPTARFWDWCGDGWVKLCIRPGATLTRTTGGPHDEGYSYTAEEWTNVGVGVIRTRETWGRDCDGRYEDGTTAFCPMTHLAARPMDGPDSPSGNAGISVPEWTYTAEHRRDHAAEAAGY